MITHMSTTIINNNPLLNIITIYIINIDQIYLFDETLYWMFDHVRSHTHV